MRRYAARAWEIARLSCENACSCRVKTERNRTTRDMNSAHRWRSDADPTFASPVSRRFGHAGVLARNSPRSRDAGRHRDPAAVATGRLRGA